MLSKPSGTVNPRPVMFRELTDIQVGAQRAERFFIPSGYQADPH
ncbi:hypothetical protein [Corallococcus sp. AB045]|nr:hypothetical protein [Corallococcus sp. AB045]